MYQVKRIKNMYIKNLLKTTAALATLFTGSQSWGADMAFSTIKSDGTLGTTHTVHGAFVAGTMPAVAVPDKTTLVLNGTGVLGSSGGVVALGKELSIDVDEAATWSIFELIATQNLDLFIRPKTKAGTVTLTIGTLVLGGSASTVKVWTADTVTATITAVKGEARVNRGIDTSIPSIDLPASLPTKVVGGRTYTLAKHYSSQ